MYAKTYQEGQYIVGYDITPGEYMLYSIGSNGASFDISKRSDDNMQIQDFTDKFENNYIISINIGEHLKLERCYAVNIEESIGINIKQTEMYKVGINLLPGKYVLEQNDNKNNAGYILKDSSLTNTYMNNYTNFYGLVEIDVDFGQYLKLNNCKIIKQGSMFDGIDATNHNGNLILNNNKEYFIDKYFVSLTSLPINVNEKIINVPYMVYKPNFVVNETLNIYNDPNEKIEFFNSIELAINDIYVGLIYELNNNMNRYGVPAFVLLNNVEISYINKANIKLDLEGYVYSNTNEKTRIVYRIEYHRGKNNKSKKTYDVKKTA